MSDSSRDYRDALLDVAEHLEAARDFANRYASFQDSSEDRMETFAVVRAIEVAGEAARRVPREVREMPPNVPWREMIGMRDRLIHGYDAFNLALVWTTATEDIPPTLTSVRRLLDSSG